MNNRTIQVLDCTLRDGAQVNEARFGVEAATAIAKNLNEAGIEIVECGFLKKIEPKDFEPGRTYYPNPSFAEPYLPQKNENTWLSALMDFGRYDVDNLEPYNGKSFDLVRVSFFEWDLDKDVEGFIKKVMDKGYRVAIQPMDTFSYSEEDLMKVINIANRLVPATLSMVDTYSIAAEKDVDRVYSVYRQYLKEGIRVGFHSHNNQLNSFSLARHFMEITGKDNKSIVIDASLFGMGRGGGNLNTELFSEYLNRLNIKKYKMKPILDSIDSYLTKFKQQYEWGYSLPMLYAGLYGVHVYTIAYLCDKPGMTSYDLRQILQRLDEHKKKRYDYDYLDAVYDAYIEEQKSKEGIKQ